MTQCHDSYDTDPLAAAPLPLLVKALMTSPAVTVEPATTVKEVAQLLLEHDIRAVPVVDIGDVLVGVVSEADVVCRECPTARHHTLGRFVDRLVGHDRDWISKAEGITAGEIMTKELVCCTPAEPVSLVARRMLSERVRMIPVLDGRQLVGVLSRHDILRIFDRPDGEVRARIAALLADSRAVPEDHDVTAQVVDGLVHLSGSVGHSSDGERVASLVAGIPGVIEVRNDLIARQR